MNNHEWQQMTIFSTFEEHQIEENHPGAPGDTKKKSFSIALAITTNFLHAITFP